MTKSVHFVLAKWIAKF